MPVFNRISVIKQTRHLKNIHTEIHFQLAVWAASIKPYTTKVIQLL